MNEIEDLHKKYAPTQEVFNLVFGHCQIVWEIAQQLIDKNQLKVDIDLVKVGCLLHDIGVNTFFDINGHFMSEVKYITHGIIGEQILKREGIIDEKIVRFASHHTGVGISKDEIIKNTLPLPHQDFFAESKEERLVMYADKFHSKTTPPIFDSFEHSKQELSKFGQDKVERFEQLAREFGIPDLNHLAKKYVQKVVK